MIVGNYIGVDVTGLAPLSNGGEGVDAYGSSNITIGGTAAGAGNVISANALDGVLVFSSGVLVQGNLIGLGSDGLTPLGNAADGIITFYDTLIGGTTAAARNVISDNGTSGIEIRGGTGAAVVQGNYIGTDVSGMLPRGNMGFGVLLNDVPGTPSRIGGTGAGTGNVISANGASNLAGGEGVVPGGVELVGRGGNLVEGNLIGLAADGTSALGNRGSGVVLASNATNNTIRLNTIAFNGADLAARSAGVLVIDTFSSGNRLDANSIYQNTGLGIDLGDDGVTANTPGSPHSGPNLLQNYPVITAVSTTSTDTVVTGSLTAAANTIYTVQFFASPAADPSGFGEGQTFLGEITDLTTNADGFANFTASLRTVIAPGQFVERHGDRPVRQHLRVLRLRPARGRQPSDRHHDGRRRPRLAACRHRLRRRERRPALHDLLQHPRRGRPHHRPVEPPARDHRPHHHRRHHPAGGQREHQRAGARRQRHAPHRAGRDQCRPVRGRVDDRLRRRHREGAGDRQLQPQRQRDRARRAGRRPDRGGLPGLRRDRRHDPGEYEQRRVHQRLARQHDRRRHGGGPEPPERQEIRRLRGPGHHGCERDGELGRG